MIFKWGHLIVDNTLQSCNHSRQPASRCSLFTQLVPVNQVEEPCHLAPHFDPPEALGDSPCQRVLRGAVRFPNRLPHYSHDQLRPSWRDEMRPRDSLAQKQVNVREACVIAPPTQFGSLTLSFPWMSLPLLLISSCNEGPMEGISAHESCHVCRGGSRWVLRDTKESLEIILSIPCWINMKRR